MKQVMVSHKCDIERIEKMIVKEKKIITFIFE